MSREPMQYDLMRNVNELVTDDATETAQSKSIYISHFISTWNSRGFEFGAVLFLANIYPGTLLPMSIYALLRALAAILGSPAIGRHIDTTNRLAVARLSILGQRTAVAASCAIFLALLTFKHTISSLLSYTLFALLIALACCEKLCIIMNTIAIERDWVVVLSGSNDGLLQEMNSQMRRIDLFCKLVSPLAVALVDGVSTPVAILATLLVNITSVLIEYFLIARVYTKVPELAVRSANESGIPQPDLEYSHVPGGPETGQDSASLLSQVKLYVKSHAFLPSLSLSMLYLTVLSFSGQMITYLFALKQPRLTSIHIGLLRTVATILEISSTFIAPLLMNKLGPVRAGIWSLSWQSFCLTPAIATFWMPQTLSKTTATYFFISCIVISRVGLWSFDLTAQLLVQNSIDATQRGAFSATESSLQNFFELCTFAMTIIWSDPQQFRYPATISLIAVYIAAGCYARFVRTERGHLLHIPACCESIYSYKALRQNSEEEDLELSSVAVIG